MMEDVIKQESFVTTPQCLICSSRINVPKRNCYGVFDKHVTEASGTALRSVTAKILKVEIKEDSVHSNVICKPCFKLLNEVDDMEVRTKELKRKINAKYQESIRMLKLNLNGSSIDQQLSPKLSDTDGEQDLEHEANKKSTEDVQDNEESEAQQENVVAEGEIIDKHCNNETQATAASCVPGNICSVQVAVDITGEMQYMVIYSDTNGECNESVQQIAVHDGPDIECDTNRECNENVQQIAVHDGPDIECDENTQQVSVGGDPDGENTDYMKGMDTGDSDDSEYTPSQAVDTNMKPLTKRKCLKVKFKKTNNEKVSLPEKLVKRNGVHYVCLVCKGDHEIMGDRKEILAHLKDAHSIRVFICDICLQCFRKRNYLTEHLDNHVAAEEGEFHCEVCNEVFHNIRLLEIHKRFHCPQRKSWTCETCGKSYGSRNTLEEHINTHTELRPFACEGCRKTFVSKYTYKVHMKSHEGYERSFACDQCGKTFFYATSLKQHVQTHSDIRNYACEQCDKTFTTARYLEIHSTVHTGYKPHICKTCGKEFSRRNEMVVHERVHTGERPFQCELCGAMFGRHCNLVSHKRDKHFQEKRFKCTVCDKGFKRQRLLDYHTKAAHTGERPFKCLMCAATFIYPHCFKKHLKMHAKKV